jgi:flagellar hook-associated protein 2
VRSELRAALTGAHGSGTYTRLAEVGIGFSRTGQLTLNEAQLSEALQADPDAVARLFADEATGAFAAVSTLVENYTTADGLVPDARVRLTDEISKLGTRIADMEARLAIRREALRRQFMAADQAMSRLTAQSGALAGFGNRLSSSRP